MNNMYESPLSSRYASDQMLYLFSPDKKFSTWRRLWVALARAEMELGLPVTQEQVEKLLEAGIMAPSAMNKQPWHFIVCRDREMMERFQTVHPYSKMLSQAPVMILVCGDTQKQPGPHFYQQDCAACTENILLAAQAMGLGGCWLGIPPQSEQEEQIAALFGLPEHIKPFCGIALGVPSVQPPQPERSLHGLVHENRW